MENCKKIKHYAIFLSWLQKKNKALTAASELIQQ